MEEPGGSAADVGAEDVSAGWTKKTDWVNAFVAGKVILVITL
jgi:hypothetical protein